MAKLNIRRAINSTIGKINPHYDMTVGNMRQIRKENDDWFGMINDSFRLGYVQGMKAAKAEMRKKVNA